MQKFRPFSNTSSLISMSSRLSSKSVAKAEARRAEEDHHSSFQRKRRFTLIELLVVIAIMAILLRSKWPFFLLFSAVFAFSRFDEKLLNTQIPNVTSSMIAG